MQSRRLRPGDLLDDYCPRERRLTDHAVVALIDEEIKRTRCLTCDEEHEYKQGRVPARRRKRDAPPAGAPEAVAPARPALSPTGREPAGDDPEFQRGELEADEAETADAPDAVLADAGQNGGGPEAAEDERRVHRRLIRAVLPRLEGQPPQARPIPEFTIRNTAAPNTAPRRKGAPWQGRPQGDSDWQPRTNGGRTGNGWSGQPQSNGPRPKQPYRQSAQHPPARSADGPRRAVGARRGKRRHR